MRELFDKYDPYIMDIYGQYCVEMHKDDAGLWVSHTDAVERVKPLVKALSDLKACNIKNMSAGELNDFVDSILTGYL